MLTVDLETNDVTNGTETLRAPGMVAELLYCLAQAMPRPVHPDRLIARLSGWQGPMDIITLRVHVSRARKVLQPLGYRIENIYAKGWFIREERMH